MQSAKETKGSDSDENNSTDNKSNDKNGVSSSSSSSAAAAASSSSSSAAATNSKTIPKRVWPANMTEAAANFNLYANREKTRFAKPTPTEEVVSATVKSPTEKKDD